MISKSKGALKKMRREEADRLSAYLSSNEWSEELRKILDESNFNNKVSLFSHDNSDQITQLENKVIDLSNRVCDLEQLIIRKFGVYR